VGMNAIPMSSEGESLNDDTEGGEELSQNVHVRLDTASALSDPPIPAHARK